VALDELTWLARLMFRWHLFRRH